MTTGFVLLLAIVIGVVAGLRSLSAPAVVAWAAHLGWLNLHGSPLHFMASVWTAGIFTLLALGELFADQLPSTPFRTNCYRWTKRRDPGGCRWRADVAGRARRGDRRSRRRIRRPSSSCGSGARATRSRFHGCCS
jgi:hypothetical protein